MTPKEKAQELYNKFNPHVLQRDFFGDDVEKTKSKECSLVVANEMLEALWDLDKNEVENNYWQKVKEEIINL